MGRKINYNEIKIPEEKAPWEYDYRERRKDIIEIHKDQPLGSIKYVDLAERYDVDPSMITRDMERIREFISNNISKKELAYESKLIIDEAVKGLMMEGEYYKAVKVLETKINKWLDLGMIDMEEDWDEDQALDKIREIAEEVEDLEDSDKDISKEVIKNAIV